MTEIWKDINGFEGYYQVSNLGRIKSLSREIYNGKGYYTSTEKILLGHMITKGYMQVELKKDNKRYLKLIHCLVAEAFIPNPENKPQVNHINGKKSDNMVGNLEWCTNIENQTHAINTGLKKSKDIELSKKHKREYYIKNRELILEKKKEYYQKNQNKIATYRKSYYEEHKKDLIKKSTKYNTAIRKARVAELRKNGCINAWNVVGKGATPKYKVKIDEE